VASLFFPGILSFAAMPFEPIHDAMVRKAAFDWLALQVSRQGDVLPRTLLEVGFQFEGVRVPMLGPQGIFKPQVLSDAPISITTAPDRPYDDSFAPSGLLRYHYRRDGPTHRDNVSMRVAMQRRLPLAYFHGIAVGKYLTTWPVFVVADDERMRCFSIAVDDAPHAGIADNRSLLGTGDEAEALRRAYSTAILRVRLHQRAFRERVLEAYKRQCAFCRLRHEELLDAAHLIPDADPSGEPIVRNGIALCALHHAAFDRYFIGIRPDCVIEVREDLLNERDGPTLAHAIQGLHNKPLILPRRPGDRPEVRCLELRYEQFRKASQDALSQEGRN
jgi:putative restriction endonuclease